MTIGAGDKDNGDDQEAPRQVAGDGAAQGHRPAFQVLRQEDRRREMGA